MTKSKIHKVVEDYEIAYPNPIRLNKDELVKIIKRETNPDWLGWVFCESEEGVKGWVSETYLLIDGNSASVIKSYDATEITAKSGELVEILYSEFGWARIKNREGSQGWIPLKNLSEKEVENEPLIQFVEFQEAHLSILRSWLREPHVSEFWQESEDDTELREKFLNQLPARGVSAFIISLESRPIGFIQYYEACKIGGGWWLNIGPGTFGIDQFIGDVSMIGKGLGTKIIKQFVEYLFANPNVQEIITDPEPENKRAVRCYEKVGFQRIKEIQTPGGLALLMKIDRPSN